ncbi:MAG: hypothetical protein Q7S89_03400 [bacterium]|nr:hypothetical protein [bacterium]
MFSHEFNAIENRCQRANDLIREACRLPNPPSVVRFFQFFLAPADAEDDESYADQQARVDAQRADLTKEARDLIESCRDYFDPILDWFEERGIERSSLKRWTIGRLWPYHAVDSSTITGWIHGLKEMQQLVELTEEAEKCAHNRETELRYELERIVRERGGDLRLDIRFQS